MTSYQQGILAPVPLAARYLTFQAKHQGDIQAALRVRRWLRGDDERLSGFLVEHGHSDIRRTDRCAHGQQVCG